MSRDPAVAYNTVLVYGTAQDRVIETAGLAPDGHAFEVGYYNGDTKKKAIIGNSPAFGCPVRCYHCELTTNGPLISASGMVQQVRVMAALAQAVDGEGFTGKPLKVSVAKTGEPTLNRHVLTAMRELTEQFPGVSFKYSSVMPDTRILLARIAEVAKFAETYRAGSIQFQVSLLSTNNVFRQAATEVPLASLERVAKAIDVWRENNPSGRIPNCSLLLHENTPCDPREVIDVIPPDMAKFRIRPIVQTQNALSNGARPVALAVVQQMVKAFREYGYNINDAGIPTGTENTHSLAANVTRLRIMHGNLPYGIYQVDPDPTKPLKPMGVSLREILEISKA